MKHGKHLCRDTERIICEGTMKAYKGFDKDMQCRGFQYEEGKTYETDKAELCETGFHACEDPLNVFRYYPPGSGSKYHEVTLEGVTDEKSDDTKMVGTKITVGAEIGIPGIIKAHVEYVKENVTKHVEAGDSEVVAVGDRQSASAGRSGSASAGWSGSASAGWYGSASAGRYGSASAGEYGSAVSRGKSSVEKNGCAVARGNGNKVRGGIGSVLVLVEENTNNCEIKHWKAEVVDGERIKADTWYQLDENGEFQEVKE